MSIINAAERRAFRMDPNLLWSVIKSQAGSVGKAILELAQNSVDANSTKLEVTITNTHVIVQDDGKGFASRKEIEDFFETFGTPHKTGDAVYGRFRMGRGQIMSFTRNQWRSGEFSMSVDIKGMGLEYDLKTLDEPAAGCRIEGEFYDPLKSSDLIRLVDEIRELCKYLPIPMFVNGERVSKDPRDVKWTYEDDDAYYLVRDSARSLEVYNLGVLVRHYYSGEFGVCGLVISKRQLQVNFARTDVLIGECEVFKRIGAQLRQLAKSEDDEKTPRNNEASREFKLASMLTGSFDAKEEFDRALMSAKVFTDYTGKHMSLFDLYCACVNGPMNICAPVSFSQKADRVHQLKLALVISPKTAARARGLTFEEILQRIRQNVMAYSGNQMTNQSEWITALLERFVDLEDVGSMIDDTQTIVELKKLSKEERIVLGVLKNLSYLFLNACDRFMGISERRSVRRLGVYESELTDGYTDGHSMIFVNRKFLKVGGAAGNVLAAFDKLKVLMLHEYLHDAQDITGHGHPAEFYERFHDALSFDWGLATFTHTAALQYLAARRKAGIKMRSGDLHTLDMVLQADISVQEVATAEELKESLHAKAVSQPSPEELAMS